MGGDEIVYDATIITTSTDEPTLLHGLLKGSDLQECRHLQQPQAAQCIDDARFQGARHDVQDPPVLSGAGSVTLASENYTAEK